MVCEKNFLAIDLGAESGRVILGCLTAGRLELSEIHRFATGPVNLPVRYTENGSEKNHNDCKLVWDFLRFWQEIKDSIQRVSRDNQITAIGVDSWGVDFALLDIKGELISFPVHYRDSRTDGMVEKAFELMPKERIYQITGLQFMQLNTLFQLLALKLSGSPFLGIADKLVMIPDLINYWLTGQVIAEHSDASTSQILDANSGTWSEEIIQAMGFPSKIFPEIAKPGTILGPLRPCLEEELNCKTTVVLPPTHDTASAVSAVPADSDDFVWISSGTWSIVGMNTPHPIINEQSFTKNYTNEGGREGVNQFSKNVTGLWLVQQLRQEWAREGQELSYTELTQLAKDAPDVSTIIDPDYHEFLPMGDMKDRIANYCQRTGQVMPKTKGEVICAVLQGLALRYRYVIEQLEAIADRKTSVIHIIGGGTKNELLNQFTADALNRKVITGPVEATATGNIIAQAIAMGDIKNWQEGVSVIKNSFEIKTYLPGERASWEKAYQRFLDNLEKVTLAF